jgi:HK97 family phage major capsid protein
MNFVEKSQEELSGMEALELQAYYVEKYNHEKAELENRVKSLEEEKNTEAYEKLAEEVKALKEDKLNTLENAVKMQGVVLDQVKNGSFNAARLPEVEGSIKGALAANIDNFKAAKEGRHDFKFELDMKAVGDMTFANNLSGGNMPLEMRLAGVNDIAERVPVVYDRVPKLTTTGNTISWVYEDAQEGAAAGTAEGSAKNQIDNNFVVTEVSLLKQTAYFKLSTEMLDEVSFMESWIRNKLIVRLLNRVDSQVIAGDGTGTNLNGLTTQATAFAAGTFANAVDNANDVDVLVVAANQIRIANHNGPLTIVMHPSDVTDLKLQKITASDKRYVQRLLQVGSTMTLDGMPIIETTAITAGDFLIGDMSKALIAEKGGIMVEVGLDGNDFTNNMRTILAEWRGEVIVQNNDTTAFVTGTFATTNAALETT